MYVYVICILDCFSMGISEKILSGVVHGSCIQNKPFGNSLHEPKV